MIREKLPDFPLKCKTTIEETIIIELDDNVKKFIKDEIKKEVKDV